MITEELTKTIFKYCREQTIERIDKHIDKEQFNSIRIALENDLDDPILYVNGKLLENKKELFNGRKKAYSLFMENYVKTL